MVKSLSVLTLVRNRQAHLEQLVEGLRRSRRPPDELVVVDMGSQVPASVGETPFPVHLIRMETFELPLAAARNAAAEVAQGDALLFLDVDCIPGAMLIGAMVEALAGQDALICADILYLGDDDARAIWTEAELLWSGRRHPVRDFPAEGLKLEPNPGLFWSLAFGIQTKRFMDIGGFDTRFTGYGAEDTDFGFRAAVAEVPLLFLGGSPAYHQHHAIYDPPLQHFADIVRNARIFQRLWRRWPMEGWLDAFATLGLIELHSTELNILRYPTAEEIEGARLA